MSYDFDRVYDRRATDSAKWTHFPEDVLPMWVADMDFRSPQPILDALHARVDQGLFGYSADLPELWDAISQRLATRNRWQVAHEDYMELPGLVSGLNVVARAIGAPGDGVVVNTPVYGPFLTAPKNQGRVLQMAEQHVTRRDGYLHYEIDFDALEAAVTPETRLFILCNPHNPTGRAYTAQELEGIAEFCLRHDLTLCSDEIHCELLLDGTEHYSIAALVPEIADRTVTLIAPSKTFNVPGLGFSVAIASNPELRAKLQTAAAGIVPHANLLGKHAALAAYSQCDDWLDALLAYLTANRDFAVEYIRQHLPMVECTRPEATYLLWLNCRAAGMGDKPQEFCLNDARIALNDGAWFGDGGDGFVRLNFGCPRATLAEGLERLRLALTQVEPA